MKKFLLGFVLLGALQAPQANAQTLGIGGFWTLNLLQSATNGPGVTIALPRANPFFRNPLVINVGFPVIGTQVFTLAFTVDFWAINQSLVSFINVYVGPGLFFSVATKGGNAQVALGGRVPIGLNIKPFNWLELFLELAPALGVVIADPVTANFLLQGAFGIRFWF